MCCKSENSRGCCEPFRRSSIDSMVAGNHGETQMKLILAGAGLSALLLLPLTANAQQGRQQTDDQTSFSQTLRAQPSTRQRHEIIRSERSTRTNRGRSVGAGE